MGLREMAVPVIVDGKPVAIIYGGQVHCGPPRSEKFEQMATQLTRIGLSAEELNQLRTAYLQTPVLTERQYRATTRLLRIFAHQLAESANGWIVVGHPHEPSIVRQAKLFMRQHLDTPLSTIVVARYIHQGADQFSRLFKKSTGLTVKEYVNRARIERVKLLLANPEKRISQAALEAGFGDFAHFNRTFKRYTGRTPRQYRSGLGRASRISLP
jgi:AraC-like DNA-binding protein